jgi:hypothetical protein
MTMVFGTPNQQIIEYVHKGFHTYLTIIWLFLTLNEIFPYFLSKVGYSHEINYN